MTSSASGANLDIGITVFGCDRDEAELFHELAPGFGVVPTIARDAVSERSVAAARGNRCVSVGHKSEISRATLRALRASGVEYVSTRSNGLDHIDLDAAEDVGITVENVVYAPDGVADYTVMLILMAVRNARDVVARADRHDFRLGGVRGRDLRDMTVGVVGVGNIGRAVVRRLRGFGCRILVCNNAARGSKAGGELVCLDELLVASDVVTLHVPLNSETRHVIGRRQIDAMKAGAFLVNTGRGALVDTDALVAALESGRLGGAALDVLEGEEEIFYFDRTTTPVDNPLLLRLQRLRNVTVTPHTAYYTARALHETIANTLTNCVNFERNRTSEEAQDRSLVRGLLGRA